MTNTLYTIGHSTHPVQKVIDLLRQHAVTAVGPTFALTLTAA